MQYEYEYLLRRVGRLTKVQVVIRRKRYLIINISIVSYARLTDVKLDRNIPNKPVNGERRFLILQMSKEMSQEGYYLHSKELMTGIANIAIT